MLFNTEFDPFTTANLINLPELHHDNSESWSILHLQPKSQTGLLSIAEIEQPKLLNLRSDVLKLDLPDISLSELESVDNPTPVISDGEDEKRTTLVKAQEQEQDFWQTPHLLIEKKDNHLISWDHFNNQEHQEPPYTFISEAGPAAFDVLLQKFVTKRTDGQTRYLKGNALLNALFDLSLGRSSAIFVWNDQSKRFDVMVKDFALSGISQASLQETIDPFLDAGLQFRRLRQSTKPNQEFTSFKIALQIAVDQVLDALEEYIEDSRRDTCSLIRLQDLCHKPFVLLGVLDNIAKDVRSDADANHLIAATLTSIEVKCTEHPEFEPILHFILSRTIQPVFDHLQSDIGLKPSIETSSLLTTVMPTLVPDKIATIYTQAKTTLTILVQHGYCLPTPTQEQVENASVSLAYRSEDIISLQARADNHEKDLITFVVGTETYLLETASHKNASLDTSDPFHFDADLAIDIEPTQNKTQSFLTSDRSDLQQSLISAFGDLSNGRFDVDLTCRQAIELSISPLLNAQHRLLSYAVLQMLFQDHNFVAHTTLLGRFQLLNDGIFASKLSTALFDSNQDSAEGNRITLAKTGLRLQSRENWPPASSELRLALMGILSESMLAIKDTTLTETISFAIRDLSDDDLERCRDVDSIYALDFLRLNYKPPNSIIEAVLTPSSLDKYDIIFNQLLRLLRIKALTETMLRSACPRGHIPNLKDNSHRFRIHAHQFISALANHSHNLVIKSAWSTFSTKLQHIATRLHEKDYTGTLGLGGGLDHLRNLHDQTLDRIARGLLLKRKQAEAKGIVDRLFEVILRFAALTSKTGLYPKDKGGDQAVQRLCQDFEVHVKALVRWLRTEAGRAGDGAGDSDSDGEVNVFECLLLRLDWNGYWSR